MTRERMTKLMMGRGVYNHKFIKRALRFVVKMCDLTYEEAWKQWVEHGDFRNTCDLVFELLQGDRSTEL